MRYRCHQCFGVIEFEDIAHLDIYSDLCWIQCHTCARAFGYACGLDKRHNPNPHGYFACPLRHGVVSPALRPPVHLITTN